MGLELFKKTRAKIIVCFHLCILISKIFFLEVVYPSLYFGYIPEETWGDILFLFVIRDLAQEGGVLIEQLHLPYQEGHLLYCSLLHHLVSVQGFMETEDSEHPLYA